MYVKTFYIILQWDNQQHPKKLHSWIKHIISLPPGHVLLQLERQPGEAVDRIWATNNHACYVAPKIPHETKSSGASCGALKNFSCSKKGFFLFFQSYIDCIYIYILVLKGCSLWYPLHYIFTSGFGNTEWQGTEKQHGSPTIRDKIPNGLFQPTGEDLEIYSFQTNRFPICPAGKMKTASLSNLVKYGLAYTGV